MDILWLIGIFLGVDLFCGTSFAHISVLPISKDFNGHGTQYRFQYYVRDERGDYKTQEEAGEGGKARGSYAVEEPDGDLRIVQYTADIGGGFKAHIKVDHAGNKTPSKLQEIEIPADEMRKLIESNRKKGTFEAEDSEIEMDQSSKSYVLGPPRKMSEIVMEQAAAIREIISKEIEADEKREAEEKLINKNIADEIDVVEKKIEKVESSVISKPEIREPKLRKMTKNEEPSTSESLESSENSQKTKINYETVKTTSSSIIANDKIQSPVVRVALTPRKINDDIEKPITKKQQIQIPAEVPVKNISYKNRIMFYKPLEKKSHQISQNESTKVQSNGELNLKGHENNNNNNNNKDIPKQEDIVLYSPYQNEGGKEGDGNSRFITVPYEVLRPYLSRIEGEEKNRK